MKLFLASALDKTLELLPQKLGHSLEGQKVIFIPNASDNEAGDKWWIDIDRKAYEAEGCKISDVDLRIVSGNELEEELAHSDIIHFCGGSVLYLIALLREKGFIETLTERVRNDRILYTGTSAGSMIVGNDLSLNKWDPEEQASVSACADDFTGLGFVNFLILPHANNSDFVASSVKMVERLPEHDQAVVALYDNQAIWYENGKLEILSS